MKIIKMSVCFILTLGLLSAQDTAKKGSETKEHAGQAQMKHEQNSPATECPHCTKDSMCEMHANEGKKKQSAVCAHCTSEKMCEMHAKKGMKKQGMKQEMKKEESKKSGVPK